MERVSSLFVIVVWISFVSVLSDGLQCKNPNGQLVDWFAALKLPNLRWSDQSDGTAYLYMDPKTPHWTYLKGITTEQSAVGHTVAQMYAPTAAYNDTIMWIAYNDETSYNYTTFTLGHSKGVLVADKNAGFWLVHSVPKFPQLPYQNNSYSYPKTGIRYGQSFLCISMMPEELEKVGDQLINNEVQIYGSHFGGDIKKIYPALFNASLPHDYPNKNNSGVRLQRLNSIKGFSFLSISKNRYFGKDLYEDLISQMTKSNLYTETWLNSPDRFNSSCSNQYKTMNIKSLIMKDVKGLKLWYKSYNDHSKWTLSVQNSKPWICIGDVNRATDQLTRGGGTVCMNSITVWNQFKKLVMAVEDCGK